MIEDVKATLHYKFLQSSLSNRQQTTKDMYHVLYANKHEYDIALAQLTKLGYRFYRTAGLQKQTESAYIKNNNSIVVQIGHDRLFYNVVPKDDAYIDRYKRVSPMDLFTQDYITLFNRNETTDYKI